MDTSLATAIIVSSSTLLGGLLASFVQWSTTKSSQSFQAAQEQQKQERERKARMRHEMQLQISKAHQILSKIGREFSLTTLDIVWRSNMTEHAYDQRYLQICDLADELRAIADLHLPKLSESVEEMYGEMNLFWGNFREVLALTHAHREYKDKEPFLQKANDAAQKLGAHVIHAKSLLSALAQVEEW